MIEDADASRPAHHFTERLAMLWPKVSDETKDRVRGGVQALERALAKVAAADRILCAL